MLVEGLVTPVKRSKTKCSKTMCACSSVFNQNCFLPPALPSSSTSSNLVCELEINDDDDNNGRITVGLF